jgi:15-cis-phytoene synthase
VPALRGRDRARRAEADATIPATAPDNTTFAPGLRLLPSDLREDAYRLYSLLRKLDDLVDEDQLDAAERVQAVEQWVQGKPTTTPETQLLTDLSRRHRMPAEAILDFCRAMRHDIARQTIQTEDDLERYCQRAGGSVGIMIARILGLTGHTGEAKMAMLGRAMQRTNIARDIDEDASHGRLYVAQSTIERFGPPRPGVRAALLRDQISRADALYDQAADAVSMLPRGKRAMALSIALYREILRQIERQGYGKRPGCVAVPAWRRQALIVKHRLPILSGLNSVDCSRRLR